MGANTACLGRVRLAQSTCMCMTLTGMDGGCDIVAVCVHVKQAMSSGASATHDELQATEHHDHPHPGVTSEHVDEQANRPEMPAMGGTERVAAIRNTIPEVGNPTEQCAWLASTDTPNGLSPDLHHLKHNEMCPRPPEATVDGEGRLHEHMRTCQTQRDMALQRQRSAEDAATAATNQRKVSEAKLEVAEKTLAQEHIKVASATAALKHAKKGRVAAMKVVATVYQELREAAAKHTQMAEEEKQHMATVHEAEKEVGKANEDLEFWRHLWKENSGHEQCTATKHVRATDVLRAWEDEIMKTRAQLDEVQKCMLTDATKAKSLLDTALHGIQERNPTMQQQNREEQGDDNNTYELSPISSESTAEDPHAGTRSGDEMSPDLAWKHKAELATLTAEHQAAPWPDVQAALVRAETDLKHMEPEGRRQLGLEAQSVQHGEQSQNGSKRARDAKGEDTDRNKRKKKREQKKTSDEAYVWWGKKRNLSAEGAEHVVVEHTSMNGDCGVCAAWMWQNPDRQVPPTPTEMREYRADLVANAEKLITEWRDSGHKEDAALAEALTSHIIAEARDSMKKARQDKCRTLRDAMARFKKPGTWMTIGILAAACEAKGFGIQFWTLDGGGTAVMYEEELLQNISRAVLRKHKRDGTKCERDLAEKTMNVAHVEMRTSQLSRRQDINKIINWTGGKAQTANHFLLMQFNTCGLMRARMCDVVLQHA